MGNKKATDVFSDWAEIGKDEGMEQGHSPSVNTMIDLALPLMKPNFTFIDIGCGNGWVVRKFQSNAQCSMAIGVDGAKNMIDKAKNIDPEGHYVLAQLPQWSPNENFDLAMSMEFMYYLQQPQKFLATVFRDWLNSNGWIVFGIDHYLENESSHNWPEKLGVHMTTLSEQDWKNCLESIGFQHVSSSRTGASDGWAGTLILMGQKP
jgi:trans-aconitate methyltransferase